MNIRDIAQVAIFGIVAGLMFVIGAGMTACVVRPGRPDLQLKGVSSAKLVVGYARAHPDPAVSGAFADRFESGVIKISVEAPKEHAMATFGRRDEGYILRIDPKRLKREPTRAEFEDVLSILSHEHAHYRQFEEGEMENYHPRGVKLSETQCTLTILVEIDAHGKACRDARTYGWTSEQAVSACARTSATIAEYILRERSEEHPECIKVWKFFADGPESVRKKASAKRLTRRSASNSGPVYMPPP